MRFFKTQKQHLLFHQLCRGAENRTRTTWSQTMRTTTIRLPVAMKLYHSFKGHAIGHNETL